MNGVPATEDVQALERLMPLYGDSVLRVCYLLLHDRELARDAAQDSFLKAYRMMDTLRENDSEKAWLMRIAVNTCRDVQRGCWWRHVDRRITPEDLPEMAAVDERPDGEPLVAVMNLPMKYRQVVVLHYYQGMSLAEIAHALALPASTVRTRLQRAKSRLYVQLEGWYFDE